MASLRSLTNSKLNEPKCKPLELILSDEEPGNFCANHAIMAAGHRSSLFLIYRFDLLGPSTCKSTALRRPARLFEEDISLPFIGQNPESTIWRHH